MSQEPPENPLDEQIQKAMEAGAFDNLPGAGKPFDFEQDRLVPQEKRLAYRIMRDNEIQPEWIMLQKEIDQLAEKARQKLRQAAQIYATEAARWQDKQDYESITRRLAAQDNRDFAQEDFRALVSEINKKIKAYNLKVPFSHLTRDLVDAEREIAKIFGQ